MAVKNTAVTYDHIFKVILIGDNGVGKSSFIRRFCEGTFVADMESTIGVDFYLSEIDVSGKKIKVSSRLSVCLCVCVLSRAHRAAEGGERACNTYRWHSAECY